MSYKIEYIEYYLPERIIDNDFLEKESGIDKAFTEEKVGIKQRHIAGNDEPTSMLAYNAARKLIDKNNVDSQDIDMLLLCTQNPDYRLPTTACIVQDKLGLKKSTMAFDINLGCSGFTHSIPIAGNFLESGKFKKAMLVMADEYSKIINYKDKNTASIFGDAGSAVTLTKCEDGYGVIDYSFGTDGSGWEKLIVRNTGTAKEDVTSELFMDGREIFKFSMFVVPKSIDEILEKNNLKKEDIKYFVMHQANKYMLTELRKRLKLTDEQMIIDMQNYGNTVSSTIPIALKNLFDKGTLKKGDLILLTGFGVGLSWSNVLYRYI
jgi:3-oxoacyl-[acyl-carrier-protein] synthase-3